LRPRGAFVYVVIMGVQNTKADKSKSVVPSLRQNNRTGVYARSPKATRLRDNQVRFYVRKLRSQCPWLQKQDSFLVIQFCRLQLLSDRVYSALRESELINGKGESKRLLQDFRRLALGCAQIAAQLGLSPASRMAIKASSTNAALDLVGQFAADEARERKQIEQTRSSADEAQD